MRIILGFSAIVSVLVALMPIGVWGLLHLYYGWVPDEATVFGMNLRIVFGCISGAGLVACVLSLVLLFLANKSERFG